MKHRFVIAAAILASALGTAALADSPAGAGYSIRNQSRTALNCRVSQQGRSATENVVIRSGQEWTRDADGRGRTIYCDPPVGRAYILQPGTRYRFVTDRNAVDVILLTS